VYRDLRALETQVGVAVWSEEGLWGVVGEEFLPPLKLTLDEAMAVVLSARLMVRYADKYDPDLAAAFEKLEGVLPQPLADHVERTLDVLAQHPRDAGFSERVHRLTRAWAERRVVTLDYEPARYAPESAARSAVVRPYLIEPSLQTHALYLIGWDETRDALRTFKIERIRDVALTPRTFELPEGDGLESTLRRAWDIIADQPPTDVVLRFSPSVAARVREATWHPTQQVAQDDDGSLTWRATVAGTIEIRLWILSWGDDVEVLAPPDLRKDVAQTHRRAGERYLAEGKGVPTGVG
jgi:predicted DNA-binding transcriptional regulator YafY